jgi:hypothetical protein
MKSFYRAVVALILVSAVLLFSDLHNRNPEKDTYYQKSFTKEIKLKLAMVHYVDSPIQRIVKREFASHWKIIN